MDEPRDDLTKLLAALRESAPGVFVLEWLRAAADGSLKTSLSDPTQYGTTADRDAAFAADPTIRSWYNTDSGKLEYYDPADPTGGPYGNGWKYDIAPVSGNMPVYLQSHMPGAVNQDDPDNSFLRVSQKHFTVPVDTTSAITIGGGAANDTRLKRIHILVALTGTCVISGFYGSDGVTPTSITIPAGSSGSFEFDDSPNEAGALTVTCSNASDTGNVYVTAGAS